MWFWQADGSSKEAVEEIKQVSLYFFKVSHIEGKEMSSNKQHLSLSKMINVLVWRVSIAMHPFKSIICFQLQKRIWNYGIPIEMEIEFIITDVMMEILFVLDSTRIEATKKSKENLLP